MRKLYLFNMITLDGYFEGKTKWDLSWHNVDKEFNDFAIEQLDQTDLIVFGRVTYEGMAAYWTTENALKDDQQVASRMNSARKIVFSRSMIKAEWNNTTLHSADLQGIMLAEKEKPGGDIGVFGSSTLGVELAELKLIDEYRFIVNPLVLGGGNTILKGIKARLDLKLLRSRSFNSGNIFLCYAPVM